jgi:hypothetical protein
MLGGRGSRGLYRFLFNFYVKKKAGMLGGRRSRGLYRLLFNFYLKQKIGMSPLLNVTLKQGQMFVLHNIDYPKSGEKRKGGLVLLSLQSYSS